MSMSYGDYSYSGFFASSSLFTKGIQGVGCDVQHVGSSSEEEEMSMYGSNNNNMNASKKRRLSMQQVKCLETCFEEESKLEPERKIQLASDLGLQPRQVAVWFQNRRARWKTKQLERDYDHLKHNYDTLLSEKNQLQVQLARLSEEVRKLKGQENQSPSNSDSLEREKAETDANGSQKTATTTSNDGDEFHSLSPSFCSDANSALQRNNCKSSSTLPLSMEEEEPCLCSNTNFQPHLDVLDYLIIQESEPDWLGGFHLCH